MNIVRARVRGGRQGQLVGFRRNRITAVLGFVPNVEDDPVKIGQAWGFEADGMPGAIWQYKGSPDWSYHGPEGLFVRLFGRRHVVHDQLSEVPF